MSGTQAGGSSGSDLGSFSESKKAVVGQFHVFVDEVIDEALEEFKPFRVVNVDAPGNSAVKKALRPVIEEELGYFRDSIARQFDVVMSYSEEIAEEGTDSVTGVEGYEREFLRNDIFYRNYVAERGREELKENLRQRLDYMANDMAPLLRTGEDDFWEAARLSYERDEAESMLRKHFAYTKTIREHQHGLKLTVEVGAGPLSTEVEYTQEALRSLERSEDRLREGISDKLDEVYG